MISWGGRAIKVTNNSTSQRARSGDAIPNPRCIYPVGTGDWTGHPGRAKV